MKKIYHAGTTCSAPGCDRSPRCLGFCNLHYLRLRKFGDVNSFAPLSVALPPIDRFNLQHEKTSGCWLWTGTTTESGYGYFSIRCRNTLAHRFAYTHFVGPIPEGRHVCHSCDTPACVNPSHLFIGTPLENERDKCNKGRQARGEKQHLSKLTADQAIEIYTSTESYTKLAARFGITKTTVHDIKIGNSWLWVTHGKLRGRSGLRVPRRGKRMKVWGIPPC